MRRTRPDTKRRRSPLGRTLTVRGRFRPDTPLYVRVARSSDRALLPEVMKLIVAAGAEGTILGHCSEEICALAMRERRAVLAFHGERLAGFAGIFRWSDDFVSHTPTLVAREYRGLGLTQRIREALIECSRKKWPHTPILSLTLSPRIEAINKGLGFEAVPYCDLTRDKEFWRSCEGCVHHGHLKRNQYQDCHCWAGLLLPPGSERSKVVPKDALQPPEFRL